MSEQKPLTMEQVKHIEDTANKIKSIGVSSNLVLEEFARISHKIVADESLSYIEISFLELIRESLELNYSTEKDENS
ncbi:hypothetical protein Pse7367_3859 (plasmid) [Thalassoporum mexicanum PCC 7367]|uniref:hypothetical protein n=1 Tax=Thalassoporum mexicanum TaxID=3457544 RepID=UPI00029FCDA5|nr:hypothetical protein [Pseudanabaena sp. PCC 7367]AFY72082.1 hypothetical protein Pse7367_3859 [Pseudanabaena sp. PCC 7367]